jgi:hypothetical protein
LRVPRIGFVVTGGVDYGGGKDSIFTTYLER